MESSVERSLINCECFFVLVQIVAEMQLEIQGTSNQKTKQKNRYGLTNKLDYLTFPILYAISLKMVFTIHADSSVIFTCNGAASLAGIVDMDTKSS